MSKDDRLTQWQEIEAATLDETVSEEEQAFRIGRRDGYSEAVQHIDMLTGGDGEYRYCLGLEDDERHCPDPDTMIARIATRLEALQAQPVGEESGWLIEMVEPDHNKSPVPRWWHPEHGWTWDANKALRFAREIDAQDYILGSGRLPGKPTEHMFLDSAGGEA